MSEKSKERGRPSGDQLRDLFRLDVATGRLYWRHARRGVEAGQEAMKSVRPTTGARFGRLPGSSAPVAAAVVVWALDRGRWPKGSVGHANGDVTDNRPGNLVADGEGQARRAVRSDNLTGCKGVKRKGDRFAAKVYRGGKMRQVGVFDTVAEAAQAVAQAEAEAQDAKGGR